MGNFDTEKNNETMVITHRAIFVNQLTVQYRCGAGVKNELSAVMDIRNNGRYSNNPSQNRNSKAAGQLWKQSKAQSTDDASLCRWL